jgi:hypothetical protein
VNRDLFCPFFLLGGLGTTINPEKAANGAITLP